MTFKQGRIKSSLQPGINRMLSEQVRNKGEKRVLPTHRRIQELGVGQTGLQHPPTHTKAKTGVGQTVLGKG